MSCVNPKHTSARIYLDNWRWQSCRKDRAAAQFDLLPDVFVQQFWVDWHLHWHAWVLEKIAVHGHWNGLGSRSFQHECITLCGHFPNDVRNLLWRRNIELDVGVSVCLLGFLVREIEVPLPCHKLRLWFFAFCWVPCVEAPHACQHRSFERFRRTRWDVHLFLARITRSDSTAWAKMATVKVIK